MRRGVEMEMKDFDLVELTEKQIEEQDWLA